jgi:hypothetical protein
MQYRAKHIGALIGLAFGLAVIHYGWKAFFLLAVIGVGWVLGRIFDGEMDLPGHVRKGASEDNWE